MADVKISALPVANDADTIEYCGLQDSLTKQIPGSAALAQTLRDLGYTPAPINSPTFTGDPKAPTPLTGDNDTSIATTAFVKGQGYVTALTAPVTSVFGRIGDVVAVGGDYDVTEVTGAAPLASPPLTGVPTAPTAAPGTSTTQIATTAFVQANSGGSGGLIGINNQSGTTYTFVLTDVSKMVVFTSSSAIAVTIPNHATVAIPTLSIIYVQQNNLGQVVVSPGSGVTISSSLSTATRSRYSLIALLQVTQDNWLLWGDQG